MNQFVYTGALQRPQPVELTTVNLTTVFTANNDATTLIAILGASDNASAVQLDYYYNDGSTDFLIWEESVAANSGSIFSGAPLRLRNGDSVKAQADVANVVTVTAIVCLQSATEAAYMGNNGAMGMIGR